MQPAKPARISLQRQFLLHARVHRASHHGRRNTTARHVRCRAPWSRRGQAQGPSTFGGRPPWWLRVARSVGDIIRAAREWGKIILDERQSVVSPRACDPAREREVSRTCPKRRGKNKSSRGGLGACLLRYPTVLGDLSAWTTANQLILQWGCRLHGSVLQWVL